MNHDISKEGSCVILKCQLIRTPEFSARLSDKSLLD